MRLRCLLPILAVISSVPVYGEAVSGAVDPLAGRPPFRRLFLDATVVEESEGLSRVFHNPQKHPRNPIIRKDKPWEGWGPYLYGTVLRDGDRFRMWYQGVGQDGADVMYAESPDGIRWTKPNLGLHPFGDTRATNIVAPRDDAYRQRHTTAGTSTSLPEMGHVQFWWIDGPARGLFPGRVAVGNVLPHGTAETVYFIRCGQRFFIDPYKNRYAATYKTTARRHRSVGVALVTGRTALDQTGWTAPSSTADDLDPDATQVYGMPVFPYQGLYIGLPWIYHARFTKYGPYSASRMLEAQEGSPRTVDVQLAWSWNLIHWTRSPRSRTVPPSWPGRRVRFQDDLHGPGACAGG